MNCKLLCWIVGHKPTVSSLRATGEDKGVTDPYDPRHERRVAADCQRCGATVYAHCGLEIVKVWDWARDSKPDGAE